MNEDVVCCYCECLPKFHFYFLKCLLFENELICVDCCSNSIVDEKAVSSLEELTGIKRSRDQIDEICRKCDMRGV